jgi:hypothetical protein
MALDARIAKGKLDSSVCFANGARLLAPTPMRRGAIACCPFN